ncbi:GNAT family N-acetyltransferase [Fulvivirga sp. RKSG066]|uniref:GNAT family N-acetyltransferase n=1 Tax=Fulvivirga aurantia TaxID=2529383 RepID=UPI0012BBFB7A|nr:GNAT family N-acetyltransferase [Fulvivirga aurantia]MTI20685.1 GNAT family N-acetyltransferase [Fulvivirga aurantia]
MVILPYKMEHRERLLEIFRLNTPKYFAPAEEGDFSLYLSEYPSSYFIIKSMGTIAGCGGYYGQGHVGRLSWNMIDPIYYAQGLGKTLINYCIDQMLNDHSITTMEVRTSQHAQSFYLKFGFNVIEHKKDFWGTGLDLYTMQRPAI